VHKMKTFKQYIKEAPAWTQSASILLFSLPQSDLDSVKIPLSSSIFKRLWPKPVRSRVFHLTDDGGLRKLKKLEGGKRSISAFYNIKTAAIQDGIQTAGGYVVEMDADVLAAAPDDIGTQPDKTGRRWIQLYILINDMDSKGSLRGFENDIEKMMIDIVKKYSDNKTITDINDAWESLGQEYRKKPKDLSKIIKDYIDGMENLMKKYSKPLKSIFFDYAFDKELVPDPDSGDLALWDEIVVNNFKVKKVHVSQEFSPDFADDDPLTNSDFGWNVPFELYHDDGDLVDYIDRTRN
jgi:hypothetical protein